MATATKRPKKQKIRNNEYYDTQALFDDLYAKSQRKHIFKDLMQYITSRENILLAYRNIKKNKGSKTRGVNRSTILSVAEKDPEALISYVRNRLNWFTPHPVRRVEIPKPDGKMRPLGIPTIEDRLIQQCILQVLEPVCEAKFYAHSYGFRPNRGTRDAIARANFLTSRNNFQYVVDIDIKGFFDNVNHAKLLKQIWTLGIRDKNLLCIISKMLKAEIAGEGVPTKGVPQGGLLSPLLSNIVLNELDWWIASQWETFQLKRHYSSHPYEYKVLRETSQLKEVLIISRICLYTKSPPKGGLFSILGQKEDNPMSKDEYYALLKAAHERTDWHDRDSIHAYNEYARELRKQMAEEDDKCFW